MAFLAALAFAFLTTDWGLHVDHRIGAALFHFTLALALASVVMVWRRSTRRHIPLATLLVVVALFRLGSAGGGDREAMEADLAAMRGVLEDPASAPKLAADAPWPSGLDARGVRAARESFEDLRSWMDSLAAGYRVGPGREPEEWLSAAYLADAGRYPEVGDYYARYGDYTGRVKQEFAPRMDSLARLHLEEAGLSARAQRGYLNGVRKSLASRGATFEAVERLCRDAVELHAFLVRVDPRVHLDPDGTTARFDDPVEQERAEALLQAVKADAAALERVREGTRREGTAVFDSA